MKKDGQSWKLKPFNLMLGIGLILASFSSQISAAPFKCTRCNLSYKKCATDENYFNSCNSRCPKDKKDPIEKCRRAHDAQQEILHAKKNDVQKQAEFDTITKGTCKQKEELIASHENTSNPFSEKEKAHILGKCQSQQNTQSTWIDGRKGITQPNSSPSEQRTETAQSQAIPPAPPLPNQVATEESSFAKDLRARKSSLRKSSQNAVTPLPAQVSGDVPPPPPLPSPAKKPVAVPPPPLPAPSASQEKVTQPQEGRGALLADIRGGTQLKKVDPAAPQPQEGRGALLAQIQGGTQLKKVDPAASQKKNDPQSLEEIMKRRYASANQDDDASNKRMSTTPDGWDD